MKLKEIKQVLRKNSTPEEQKLWFLLKDRNFHNYKFRRQVSMDGFIVDFCCFEKRLVIELDGAHHRKTKLADYARDKYLREQNFKVLRFWNSDLNTNIKTVLSQIHKELITPSSVRSGIGHLLPRGEKKI